ncbi:hypothetical protein ZIOFF_042978 [Zingiber officinale]|uniref:PCI domain-containing protein n=1 Tax=Zingiber officinale TaxID=94328 RepID=A0A8J5FVQ9_ZINOF|nr:hypothetical protein ZIOFF_042978 [Zingiber officinale]
MTADVEMKEVQTPSNSVASAAVPSTLQHLKEIAALIETGAQAKEALRVVRAVRLTMMLRRKLKAPVVSAFLGHVLTPGSEAFAKLSSFLLKAKACSSASIAQLRNMNRRTVDVLASRLYLYYSFTYELTNSLAEIRGTLLALHRMTTLRRDELGQFCRYLFYLGKIRTIQLEYTDAKESLLQAARKAPVSARGFRIQCSKWAIIVRLLLGEIPDRTVFMQKGMRKALSPYFELTNAVRIGDLELFRTVAEKFSGTFSSDKTHNLIVRLRHNVIRTGLRNISISYSRISLADVARKLRLDSANPVADAESIVAKAIRDGAIDATIDHADGWMVSKETGDVYSTIEPQIAFNSRIAFCLNMHNEAVRALRFPLNSNKEMESEEKRRERQQQEQELAKHIAEEDDDDF